MLPDRVSNPGPLTYESGALPIALRGPANSINAIKINTCGQLNRPDMSLLSLYYHVSGQSSSANEKGSYFVLINIHKKWSHDR